MLLLLIMCVFFLCLIRKCGMFQVLFICWIMCFIVMQLVLKDKCWYILSRLFIIVVVVKNGCLIFLNRNIFVNYLLVKELKNYWYMMNIQKSMIGSISIYKEIGNFGKGKGLFYKREMNVLLKERKCFVEREWQIFFKGKIV